MTFLLYFFLTFIAVALYFLMSMPSVGYDTLTAEFGVFSVTSIIALCVNMWLQFWLPGKKTLLGAAILSFLLEKFYRLDQPVDLLVGFRGVNHLVECKTGHKGYGKGLNSNQAQFAACWKGSPVVTLHSPDEAIAWAHKVSKGQ